ncbi:acyltransferase family protein [Cyanobacteria bacterium FACHB-63]|nr:acyltransferase family protein [Cyanobacteria bacterium FACHB-63]
MQPASSSTDTHLNITQAYPIKKGQRFEGFDLLRAIFAVAIIAYKTQIFYIPKLWAPGTFTTALSDYVLSGMLGALAVPVFLQISLFIFQLKTKDAGLRYFIRKRLRRLVSLYLFWVGLITAFDILFVDGLDAVKFAITSPKSFLLFVVSGNSTPYFFFFSLIFLTIIAEILVLFFSSIDEISTRFKISYNLLFASSILVFAFSTIEPIILHTGIQSSFLRDLSNLTRWDYSPLNFLPYVFTAAITAQEYNIGKLDHLTSFLKRKLYCLFGLTLVLFTAEWILTSDKLLIQVDQAPLDHYMRLSLVSGSWLLLYLSLFIERKLPAFIKSLAACSLGIYGFHVFFTFKRPLPLKSIPMLGDLFQAFPLLHILAIFWITLIGSITLTVACKKFKILRELT